MPFDLGPIESSYCSHLAIEGSTKEVLDCRLSSGQSKAEIFKVLSALAEMFPNRQQWSFSLLGQLGLSLSFPTVEEIMKLHEGDFYRISESEKPFGNAVPYSSEIILNCSMPAMISILATASLDFCLTFGAWYFLKEADSTGLSYKFEKGRFQFPGQAYFGICNSPDWDCLQIVAREGAILQSIQKHLIEKSQ